MNDNTILACILFAKSQRLAVADEAAAELAEKEARITKLEALLREVTTSIEFDELGLGSLREKIDRLLVTEPEPLLHLFSEKTMHCVQCGIYYGEAVLATCPGKP
jgi:hypothetical protein